ncbi:hypothetical protein BGZ68_010831, partial [Mortierella alpina]
MKIAFITLAALLAVVSAAPSSADGNTKCNVQGFKPSYAKIGDCCLSNNGGSDVTESNGLDCTLPGNQEGSFRTCVKKLGYATTVNCAADTPAPPPEPADMAACTIEGFKINNSKVGECCLSSNGGYQDETVQGCNLYIDHEGRFRRCIKNLGFATTVDCEYNFICFADLTPEAKFLWASDSIEDCLGYTPEEVVGVPGYTLLYKDDVPVTRASHQEHVFSDLIASQAILAYRHKDGGRILVEVVFSTCHAFLACCAMVLEGDQTTYKAKLQHNTSLTFNKTSRSK